MLATNDAQERRMVTHDTPDLFLLDERLHLVGAQRGVFAA